MYIQVISSLEVIRKIINETSSENISTQLEKIDSWRSSSENSDFLQYIATPSRHLFEDESDEYYDIILPGLKKKDFPFVLATHVLYSFLQGIKCFGFDVPFQNNEKQKAFIDYIYGGDFAKELKPCNFPETFISFEGLSYFINTIDVFDFIQRERAVFSIDTNILNIYERKPGLRKIGGKGYLTLDKDGFRLFKLVYEGQEYFSGNDTEAAKIALYCFYCGIKTYMTVTSHLIDTHIINSSRTTSATREYLHPDNPLRILLLPTEINTLNCSGRAVSTLLRKDFGIHSIFSFTFDGLKALLKDHLQQHRTRNDCIKYMHSTFLSWLELSELELTYLPFRDLNRLFMEIKMFVETFIDKYDEIYGIETIEEEWVAAVLLSFENNNKMSKKEKVKCIVGYMYFLQVRHALMSNSHITYISNMYASVIPEKIDGDKSFYTLSQQFEQFIISSGTSLKWFPMNLDVSRLLLMNNNDDKKNLELKQIWETFYTKWNALEDEIQNPLLKPSEISISTGL